MQILNIMQCTNLGGMEQASLRLMLGLKKRGHSCQVISLNPIGSLGHFLEVNDISAEGLKYLGKGGWRSFGHLGKRFSSLKADVLIMTGHNLLAMHALRKIDVKKKVLAMHFHHHGVKPAWQWRLIYRMACSHFDIITYPSNFIRNEAINLYPRVANISRVVRNPIYIPEIPSVEERCLSREMLKLPSDGKVIGNAGWLIRRKRFDIFLNVAKRVADSNPAAYFVVAGDGNQKSSLQRLAADLGISDRVRWLGWMQDMSVFYKAIDVLLFNSDWDALGNTPLEAMSYGVPVVASVENGGLNEFISDERYGYLFKHHDIEGMAEAIRDCLSNKGSTQGTCAREMVRRLCDVDRIALEVTNMLV